MAAYAAALLALSKHHRITRKEMGDLLKGPQRCGVCGMSLPE